MTTHILHTFKDHSPNDESELSCFICNGGLALCKVCGGAEACLPTDCPGGLMTPEQADAVQADQLDFVNGEWKRFP